MMMSKAKANVVKGAGDANNLQLFYDTYMKFINLSCYLFGSKNPIYDINEMPSESEFFVDAVSIAEQLEIDWETMTHEGSNRIMLALLEDYYQAMAKVTNKRNLAIEVKLMILNNDKR